MSARVLGILGGMGPAASAELYRRITVSAHVDADQDHPRIVIDSNAKVPDRTRALVHDGEDPTPYLVDSARLLAAAGVDLVVMPCNTAHAYLEAVRDAAGVEVIDMVAETARRVPATTPTALLATTGTLEVGLYQRHLAERDVPVVLPDATGQRDLMDAIHLVKAGREPDARPIVATIAGTLAERGAQVALLGCTELSVLGGDVLPIPVLDPLWVLTDVALSSLGVPSRRQKER